MSRRLSIVALFAAWLCASGAMLDLLQVAAWARMFTRYAQSMPVEEAACETVDPQKPCALCLAVRRAREKTKQDAAASVATDTGKLVLVLHEEEPIVFAPEFAPWPEAIVSIPDSWRDAVPVPPPRSGMPEFVV